MVKIRSKKRSIESMMRYDESMLVRGIVKTTEAALPLRGSALSGAVGAAPWRL